MQWEWEDEIVKIITGGRKVKKEMENLDDCWIHPGREWDLGSRENSELSA